MRSARVVIVSVLVPLFAPFLATDAGAVNAETSLVLHAVETAFGPCEIPDPCPDPTVSVAVGSTIAAYLVVRNYDDVVGLQTAFDWGDWVFLFGLWDCRQNQVNGTTPAPPGGPTAGTIATVFDCMSGGASAVVGRLHLQVTGAGCLTQVDSSFPFATHVVDCANAVSEIELACRGAICAPDGGENGCEPCGPGPVEPSTWGRIKAGFGRR